MGPQACSPQLGQGPECRSPGPWAGPAPLSTEPGQSGKGGVPVREAVCTPHCPLTERGQVEQALRAEPPPPWCTGFPGPPSRRAAGQAAGPTGPTGICSLGVRETSGGSGVACSCEGGAFRPLPPGGGRCSPCRPRPSAPSPPAHPRSPRLPSVRPSLPRLDLGPALLQPDTAPQCHLFRAQPPSEVPGRT